MSRNEVFEKLNKEMWAINPIRDLGKEMLNHKPFVNRLAGVVMCINKWDYEGFEPRVEAVELAKEFIVRKAEGRA